MMIFFRLVSVKPVFIGFCTLWTGNHTYQDCWISWMKMMIIGLNF